LWLDQVLQNVNLRPQGFHAAVKVNFDALHQVDQFMQQAIILYRMVRSYRIAYQA